MNAKERKPKLKTHREILAQDLKEPAYREAWDSTQFAHAVAMRIIQYRVDNNLSQTALANKLGMKQPAIARLEAGDHEPSLGTLVRLSKALGIEFHIQITPKRLAVTA